MKSLTTTSNIAAPTKTKDALFHKSKKRNKISKNQILKLNDWKIIKLSNTNDN